MRNCRATAKGFGLVDQKPPREGKLPVKNLQIFFRSLMFFFRFFFVYFRLCLFFRFDEFVFFHKLPWRLGAGFFWVSAAALLTLI